MLHLQTIPAETFFFFFVMFVSVFSKHRIKKMSAQIHKGTEVPFSKFRHSLPYIVVVKTFIWAVNSQSMFAVAGYHEAKEVWDSPCFPETASVQAFVAQLLTPLSLV